MSVIFKDNSIQCKRALDDATKRFLEQASGELEAQVKRNCDNRVDTGQLKTHWQHKVVDDCAYVFNDLENAIWEEFGTGIYAENGGRQTPWKYYYDGNKGERGWRKTRGKTKNPKGLRVTFKGMKTEIENMANDIFKEVLK